MLAGKLFYRETTTLLLLSLFSVFSFPAFANTAEKSRDRELSPIPNYNTQTDWRRITEHDTSIQAEFLRLLEGKGYGSRLVRIPMKTPHGNAVTDVKGAALPLTGLVVTHSMDGSPKRNNDIPSYLNEGYDCMAVSKDGKIFVIGSAFVRTAEPYVPNRTAINITFDINAEKGEKPTQPQIAAAADIAEALQLAFARFQTNVPVHFKDHHDPGLKPGKRFHEACEARDAANARLKSLREKNPEKAYGLAPSSLLTKCE
jgi:hypothetical protein